MARNLFFAILLLFTLVSKTLAVDIRGPFSLRQVPEDVSAPCAAAVTRGCVQFIPPLTQADENCTRQLGESRQSGELLSESCCDAVLPLLKCWAETAEESSDCDTSAAQLLANLRQVAAAGCGSCLRSINLEECASEFTAIMQPVGGVQCLSELQQLRMRNGEFDPRCCNVALSYLKCAAGKTGDIPACEEDSDIPNFKFGVTILETTTCAMSDESPNGTDPPTGPDGSTESPSAAGGDDDVCFPASATVVLESGTVKTMAELVVGDRVQTGPQQFSDVYFFSHRKHTGLFKFVQITTDNNDCLSLTPNHYVRSGAGGLVAARSVKEGDFVMLGGGDVVKVTRVDEVRDRGLFNPHTLSGDLIVNGVATSTYTTSVRPGVAQVLLAPIRWMYAAGLATGANVLDDGAGSVVGYMPKGAASE